MIKSGMAVLYQSSIYRVRSVVDYKPYALAWLNTDIYVPVEQLNKLDEV